MKTNQPNLIEPPRDDRIRINGRCVLRQTDGYIVVFVRGEPIFSYDIDDLAARRLAIVQLAESKVASQAEIARGFAVKRLTVHRQIEKYRAGGVEALVPQKRGPKGPRVTGGRRDTVIAKRKESGESNYQIAARLGVSESSVRQALKRMGYEEKAPVQAELPVAGAVEEEEACDDDSSGAEAIAEVGDVTDAGATEERVEESKEVVPADGEENREGSAQAAAGGVEVPVVHAFDTDPTDRAMDRFLARVGFFDARQN